MKSLKIGLFGFGVVGEGIYRVISNKPQLGVEIKRIAIKDISKDRNADSSLFTNDKNVLLRDSEIDLIVELIDDDKAAFDIVTEAMKNGKSVISANKKLIADHHLELIEISQENNVSFLYEASVCGSVPIIRNLEEYFDNDLLQSIQGIVNGSTNFILSKMMKDSEHYSDALSEAQKSGFAESNPTLDVEGYDAAFKLSILSLHAFGKKIQTDLILRKGITSIHSFDMRYAREKNCVIKLIAKADTDDSGDLKSLSVLPTFINSNDSLGLTNNEFNGVIVGSVLADKQFFYGKGAGRYPTSSAVLSDISAYNYGYKYEYKKGLSESTLSYQKTSKFYIGFEKSKSFDRTIFSTIDEEFNNHERAYFTGSIDHAKLKRSGILDDPDLSIISFN